MRRRWLVQGHTRHLSLHLSIERKYNSYHQGFSVPDLFYAQVLDPLFNPCEIRF
eukprot:c3208_g1_i1 orf=380-541(+)